MLSWGTGLESVGLTWSTWHILPPHILLKATFSLECVFMKERKRVYKDYGWLGLFVSTRHQQFSLQMSELFFYYLSSCTKQNIFENKGYYCQVYKVLVSETSCLLAKDLFTEHLSLATSGYTSYNFNITSKGNKMCKHVTTSTRNYEGKLWGKLCGKM